MRNFWTVKNAASILDVHPDTIKYWEDNGLIPPAKRHANGYRIYNEENIREIARIRGVNSPHLDSAIWKAKNR